MIHLDDDFSGQKFGPKIPKNFQNFQKMAKNFGDDKNF